MRLYLVQHGEAKPVEEDPDRPLTEKGVRDVEAVAKFLKLRGVQVSAVWHSGKTRAAQTAEILAKAIDAKKGVVQHKGLSPKDDVEPVADDIREKKNDLMIVGHLPFLSRLASELVTGKESKDVVAFRQGGVVCLEVDEDGGAQVAWEIVPELVQ